MAGVQSQVQGPIDLEAEAARRVVDLHRRHAQVGQHEVEAAPRLGQQSGDAAEVHAPQHQHRRVVAQATQARFGARQFPRVHIDAEQAAAGRQARQQFLRVPAEAERRVEADLARLRI